MYRVSAVCTPPATKRPGESLAAPAAARQGACTIQRCLLRLASSAATRPGLSISSRSFLRSALSFLLLVILIQVSPPTMATISAAIPNATGAVTCSMFTSPSVVTAFIVLCCLLALVLFHLVIVPAMAWAVRRFG